MLLILPLVLYFSYFPVIGLGSNESMNFELSLPLLWLVVFGAISCLMILKKKDLIKDLKQGWMWLMFPVWLSLSVIWSVNSLRGILTVGILWLIVLAVYAMWKFRDLYDDRFKARFLKWFFGTSLIMCGWCVLQCVLDLAGVSREYSLMCEGCTYEMFGFPHPNGMAIEPQFMGNLLIAPTIISGWLMLCSRPRPAGPFAFGNSRPKGRAARAAGAKSRAAALRNAVSLKHYAILIFIFASVLFLTFSRGAIYAFGVGMVFLSVFFLVREKKKLSNALKRLGVVWGVIVLSFLFTLNVQGVMAEISPTNEGYKDGVARVLNHLSLGVIDIREETLEENTIEEEDKEIGEEFEQNNSSAFDGYVPESTDTRVRLTSAAIKIWSMDLKTMFFGVGLGGAGQALYDNDLSPAPKEIIQNQYASLLLEMGLIGVSLLIWLIIVLIRKVIRYSDSLLILTLLVIYGITLCFFAGLPNALHIYLLTGLFIPLFGNNWCHK